MVRMEKMISVPHFGKWAVSQATRTLENGWGVGWCGKAGDVRGSDGSSHVVGGLCHVILIVLPSKIFRRLVTLLKGSSGIFSSRGGRKEGMEGGPLAADAGGQQFAATRPLPFPLTMTWLCDVGV